MVGDFNFCQNVAYVLLLCEGLHHLCVIRFFPCQSSKCLDDLAFTYFNRKRAITENV